MKYKIYQIVGWWFMVFNATFNSYIVAVSFLMEKIGAPGENHRSATSHRQTLSHYHLAWTGFELTTFVVIGTVDINPTIIRSR